MPSRGSAQQPLLRVADNPETIRPDLDRGGEAAWRRSPQTRGLAISWCRGASERTRVFGEVLAEEIVGQDDDAAVDVDNDTPAGPGIRRVRTAPFSDVFRMM